MIPDSKAARKAKAPSLGAAPLQAQAAKHHRPDIFRSQGLLTPPAAALLARVPRKVAPKTPASALEVAGVAVGVAACQCRRHRARAPWATWAARRPFRSPH
jgi:hypothetical protein